MNKRKKYKVFNYTDNIYATDKTFLSKKSANQFIEDFRKRYEVQGYYKDNQWNKIPPSEIDLLVIEQNFIPYSNNEI